MGKPFVVLTIAFFAGYLGRVFLALNMIGLESPVKNPAMEFIPSGCPPGLCVIFVEFFILFEGLKCARVQGNRLPLFHSHNPVLFRSNAESNLVACFFIKGLVVHR